MRVGVGGLLTPDGCIEEVTVPGVVTCYLPAAFTGVHFAWFRHRVGLGCGWSPGLGCGSCEQCVDSVVAGVRTWWRYGVCVWGGSVASVERNPLLG